MYQLQAKGKIKKSEGDIVQIFLKFILHINILFPNLVRNFVASKEDDMVMNSGIYKQTQILYRIDKKIVGKKSFKSMQLKGDKGGWGGEE